MRMLAVTWIKKSDYGDHKRTDIDQSLDIDHGIVTNSIKFYTFGQSIYYTYLSGIFKIIKKSTLGGK